MQEIWDLKERKIDVTLYKSVMLRQSQEELQRKKMNPLLVKDTQ